MLPQNPATLLEALRWKEDTMITNCFGDRVWLKALYNPEGKRIGLTDCCLVSDPCEWHESCEKINTTCGKKTSESQ